MLWLMIMMFDNDDDDAVVDDHDVLRPWEELVIFIKPPKHAIGVGNTFPFYIAFSSWVIENIGIGHDINFGRMEWPLLSLFHSKSRLWICVQNFTFLKKFLLRDKNYERWQIWCPRFGEVSMLTLSPILWHCPCWHWPAVSLFKDFLKPLN